MLRSLIIAVFMLAFAQRARAQQRPPGQSFPQRMQGEVAELRLYAENCLGGRLPGQNLLRRTAGDPHWVPFTRLAARQIATP